MGGMTRIGASQPQPARVVLANVRVLVRGLRDHPGHPLALNERLETTDIDGHREEPVKPLIEQPIQTTNDRRLPGKPGWVRSTSAQVRDVGFSRDFRRPRIRLDGVGRLECGEAARHHNGGDSYDPSGKRRRDYGHRRCFGRLGLPVERPVGGHVLHNELKASELHGIGSLGRIPRRRDVARERVRRLANMGRLSDR